MATRRRDPGKEQFWRQVIQRQRQSGGSIRAFCERAGLSQPSFYQWRRELARRDRAAVPRRGAADLPPATFVPIQVVPEAALIEIALPGGVVVRVRPGADAATLRHVVAALAVAALAEGRSC